MFPRTMIALVWVTRRQVRRAGCIGPELARFCRRVRVCPACAVMGFKTGPLPKALNFFLPVRFVQSERASDVMLGRV